MFRVLPADCCYTNYVVSFAVLLAVVLAGCSKEPANSYGSYGSYGGYSNYGDNWDQIKFLDAAPANAQPVEDFEQLKFVDLAGKEVDLQQYLGKKNVVLVVTRGMTGTLPANGPAGKGVICMFCATQTSRMASNYPEFQKRDAEVVAVFPVAVKEHVPRITEFQDGVKKVAKKNDALPFPLVLDVELKAVDALGIRKDLSKPATYIVDRDGKVRYAYVGESLVDRPTAQALLGQLDEINKSRPADEPANATPAAE